jgi:hypothetical protein
MLRDAHGSDADRAAVLAAVESTVSDAAANFNP